MGRLWLVIGSIITVAVLGLATLSVVNVVAHEDVTETATFAADGVARVEIDNDHGRVEVAGADVQDISVVAEIRHGLQRTDTAADIVDGALVVRSDCPDGPPFWCQVDYRLVVPRSVDVEVRNRSGGLVLRDLDGEVTADGDNGSMELTRLTGNVGAETDNGGVRGAGLTGDEVSARSSNGSVRLSFAESPTTVVARTSNGSVEVVVPDDGTTYRVEVDNFVGSTDAAIRTDPASERSIVATTSAGSVTVRYP